MWGSETGIRFPVVKLLDYLMHLDMLESSDNPFALSSLAHLETRKTRQNPDMRFESKLRFVKSLYIRGWDRKKIIMLFHFIDWVMRLPGHLEDRLWDSIHKIEEESKMPYINGMVELGKYVSGSMVCHIDFQKNNFAALSVGNGREKAYSLPAALRN